MTVVEAVLSLVVRDQVEAADADQGITPNVRGDMVTASPHRHCQLGVDSALLRLEVVRPRSFSTHTLPHPIR